jgi:acyl carrier protein
MRSTTFCLVRTAIGELNEELAYDSLSDVTESTPLYGGEDGIDSLSLVSLIVDIEGRVSDAFGRVVVLADEKAMSERNSPYRSVGTLVDFIIGRIEAA